MERFENKLTKKIYDNVHGFIYLTKEEKDLLSTPYFQRLNHIKQLGLSYFVFPGAVHTRFSHSLGVLHITEKLIQRLKKLKNNPFKDDVNFRKHKIARLAALLHDIGHYPLSHTIESSYKECAKHLEKLDGKDSKLESCILQEEQNITDSKNSSNRLVFEEFSKKINSEKLNDFFSYDKEVKHISLDKYHHEKMAATVINSPKFKQLLIDKFKLNQDDIDLICSIIDGTNKDEDFFIISKLIKSNFDADQMDYMLRDTSNTGISVSIDLDFIIENMDIKKYTQYKSIGGKDVICFDSKALPAIEQFLLAKYYWYSNILYYDKAYIINFMARRLFSYILLNNNELKFNTLEKIKTSLETPEEFFFFNDSLFWNELHNIIENKNDKYPELIVNLAKMFVNRDFPILLNEEEFKKRITSINNSVINFKPSIMIENEKITKTIKQFRSAFQDEEYLVPIPIDKEIVKVSSDESKGENKIIDTEIIEEDEQKRIDLDLYLKNEDIFITSDSGRCKKISDGSNSFLGLFFEGRKPKKLFIFRLYDFKKCMIKD